MIMLSFIFLFKTALVIGSIVGISFLLKKYHKIFRIISLFVLSLPCLFVKITQVTVQEHSKTPKITYFILFSTTTLILLYLLYPCLIKNMFLMKPYNTDTYLKILLERKIKDVKESIQNLKHSIHLRKLRTPDINWNDKWVISSQKKIENQLGKLGYKDINPSLNGKLFEYLLYLAHLYTLPISRNDRNILSIGFKKKPAKRKPLRALTAKYIIQERDQMLIDSTELNRFNALLLKLLQEQKIYKKKFTTTQLINQPIYLDKLTQNPEWNLINFLVQPEVEEMTHDHSSTHLTHSHKTMPGIYNYNYSLSFWIFIHEQPPNHGPFYNTFASIINFGNKPQILYNMQKQLLQIKVKTQPKKDTIIFETSELPMQKWHNFVLNFVGGTLDIFINNKIVAVKENIVPHSANDIITIGQKNGLSGGICNVIYFPSFLSKMKISLYYHILRNLSTPILPNCNI